MDNGNCEIIPYDEIERLCEKYNVDFSVYFPIGSLLEVVKKLEGTHGQTTQ